MNQNAYIFWAETGVFLRAVSGSPEWVNSQLNPGERTGTYMEYVRWMERPRFNAAEQRPYNQKRADVYPSVGDQLGALWEALAVVAGGPDKLSPQARAMHAKITEVKGRFPKPAAADPEKPL